VRYGSASRSGTGKTHSMSGSMHGLGLIGHALHDLLGQHECKAASMSVLEVFNEVSAVHMQAAVPSAAPSDVMQPHCCRSSTTCWAALTPPSG
jgi:hypothetical protein